MTHDLFSSFESFASASASPSPLLVCDGAGQYRSAVADKVLLAAQQLLASQVRGTSLLDSPAVVKDFLRTRLGALPHEVFAVVHLDVQYRVLNYVEMFRGTVSQASVYPREIVRDAMMRNSSAVLLVHNHPSGVAEPSRPDEALTQNVKQALALVDVRVIRGRDDGAVVRGARAALNIGGFGPFFCTQGCFRVATRCDDLTSSANVGCRV